MKLWKDWPMYLDRDIIQSSVMPVPMPLRMKNFHQIIAYWDKVYEDMDIFEKYEVDAMKLTIRKELLLLFFFFWYSEYVLGSLGFIMEYAKIKRLKLSCSYVNIGFEHTILEIIRVMKELVTRDPSLRNKIVFEDDWGATCYYIATANWNDKTNEFTPVPENYVLDIEFDGPRGQVWETNLRTKLLRLKFKVFVSRGKKSDSQIILLHLGGEDWSRFSGMYALAASQNWLTRVGHIFVQNLNTRIFEMACNYLSNSTETADSYRDARQKATSMGRFMRDALNRNVEFENINRGYKRGLESGYHYSAPRFRYDGYAGHVNGHAESKLFVGITQPRS